MARCFSSRPTPMRRAGGWWPSTWPIRKPEHWKEIIPQTEATLAQVSFVGDRFIACYLKDVVSQVKDVRHRRPIRPRCRLAGHRHGGRLRRQADRQGDLLRLFEHRHAAEHLPLRHGHRREPPVPPGRSEVQPGRLRGQAGLLPQQGRHANPDVHRRQEGHQARRLATRRCCTATAASTSRCRRCSPSAGVAWMEMGGVYAQPNLRGGGEYGEAWHRAGTKLEEAERLRRLHRRGRVARSPRSTRGPTSWPSRAAATAGCWSAR